MWFAWALLEKKLPRVWEKGRPEYQKIGFFKKRPFLAFCHSYLKALRNGFFFHILIKSARPLQDTFKQFLFKKLRYFRRYGQKRRFLGV